LPPLSPASRAEAQQALGALTGDGNPLDAWGNGDYATNFPRALALLGGDPSYDVVAFCSDSFEDQPFGTPERLMAYARMVVDGAARSPKPFYYMTTRSGIFRRDVHAFLREHGIAVIGGTRQGLGALDRLARWAAEPKPERRAVTRPFELLFAAGRTSVHERDASVCSRRPACPSSPSDSSRRCPKRGRPLRPSAIRLC
jgi:acyl-CoA synthetase (NDP forming)